MKHLSQYFFVSLLLFIISGCSTTEKSPLEEMKVLTHKIEQHFEKKEGRKLKGYVDSNYYDDRKRTKKDIDALITFHLLRNQKIHILTHVVDAIEKDEGSIELDVFAAMAGRSGKLVELLDTLRSDVYRFKVKLVKNDSFWVINHAYWERATPDDILTLINSLD